MNKKKEYLAEIFLKVSKHNKIIRNILRLNLGFLKGTYTKLSDEDFQEIEKSYNTDNYIQRAVLIIDSYFSEEELNKLIDFFSSPLGQKISDSSFTTKLEKLIKIMTQEAEKELNAKQKNYIQREKT